MTTKILTRIAIILLGLVTGHADAATLSDLFVKSADIPLGARTSRFDYESLDPTSGRLFIANMGAGRLLVFDTHGREMIADIDNFPKVTGVLAVPGLQKIYASVPGAGIGANVSVALGMAGLSSGAGQVAVLDSATLKELARLPGGVFPDGLAYDPADQRIFVSDELGRALTVIDAVKNSYVGRVDVGGEVGNVQYDPITRKIYAPLQSRNELVVVDPATLNVADRIALPGAEHPHGLRLAMGAAIAYAAGDENDTLLVVDLKARKVLQSLPLGRDPDVLADDPVLQRLYVASESGMLSVFDIQDPAHPQKIGDVFAGDNAHSLAVDPDSHALFLPLRDLNGQAVLRVLNPRMR